MANEKSQNERGVYQIAKITYVKGGDTLNVYMRAEGGRIKKSVTRWKVTIDYLMEGPK